MQKVEYRVRPVTRYIVTRYSEFGDACGSDVCGEFDNENSAIRVAMALGNEEPDQPAALDEVIVFSHKNTVRMWTPYTGWDCPDNVMRPVKPGEG